MQVIQNDLLGITITGCLSNTGSEQSLRSNTDPPVGLRDLPRLLGTTNFPFKGFVNLIKQRQSSGSHLQRSRTSQRRMRCTFNFALVT